MTLKPEHIVEELNRTPKLKRDLIMKMVEVMLDSEAFLEAYPRLYDPEVAEVSPEYRERSCEEMAQIIVRLFRKNKVHPDDAKDVLCRARECYLNWNESQKKECCSLRVRAVSEDNDFLKAIVDATNKRAYEIYNLYGTIRRVLFEGRKEERANALSQLIQQQGGNIGGKTDPNSPDELEAMKQQLAEIDKMEEVVLFKDETGKIRWVRLNGERWA